MGEDGKRGEKRGEDGREEGGAGWVGGRVGVGVALARSLSFQRFSGARDQIIRFGISFSPQQFSGVFFSKNLSLGWSLAHSREIDPRFRFAHSIRHFLFSAK